MSDPFLFVSPLVRQAARTATPVPLSPFSPAFPPVVPAFPSVHREKGGTNRSNSLVCLWSAILPGFPAKSPVLQGGDG